MASAPGDAGVATADDPDLTDDLAAPVAVEAVAARTSAGTRTARRALIVYAGTVFILITLNFFLPRAMPGDPIDALLDGESPSYVQSEALREELRAYYGLDRPLGEQYLGYLGDLAQGDFGTSIRFNTPVSDLLAERLPWTLLLVVTSVTMAAVAGLAAGVHSGWHRGRPVDRGLLAVFLSVRNFPVFFLASIALYVFAVKLGWVPIAGAETRFTEFDGIFDRVADIAHHLVLPATVLASRFVADDYLFMRAGMVNELGADYLLLGRAKGLRERRLKYAYAGRNALLPVVTVLAIQPGTAVTAAVFVETVFAYPGIGRLMFESVSYRDYPTMQACFLILTLFVVTANLLADLLYARLDPRTADR
ncbi:ABC transporter permease [soil metagenome]